MSIVEGEDLYALLGVERDASTDEVSKAYRKAAVQCHPDKVKPEEAEAAKLEFQKIGVAYSILKDAEKREAYDDGGEVANLELPGDMGIGDFVAGMFRKFSFEEIDDKMGEMKGSEQELEWLKADYSKFKGDFLRVLDDGYVVYDTLDPAEEDRLCGLIEGLIKGKKLKSTKQWKATRFTAEYKKSDAYKKRWAKKRADAKVAAKMKEEALKKNPRLAATKTESLGKALAVQGAEFINKLHSKLAKKYKVKKELEIDPEAFAAARKKIAERKAATGSCFAPPAATKRKAEKGAPAAKKARK